MSADIDPSRTGNVVIAYVRVSTGYAFTQYAEPGVTCHMVSTSGRELDRTIKLQIRSL